MLSVAYERRARAKKVRLALGLTLMLTGACRSYRPCSTASECEPGDACLAVSPEPGAERYCGRSTGTGPTTDMLTTGIKCARIASQDSQAMSEFGRQIFLRRLAGTLRLLVTETNGVHLFDVGWDGTTGSIAPTPGFPLAGATSNQVYFSSNEILRTFNTGAPSYGTSIDYCAYLGSMFTCANTRLTASSFTSDTGITLFSNYALYGDKTNKLQYFDLSGSASGTCAIGGLSYTNLSSAAASAERFVVGLAGQQSMGQAVLASAQISGTDCQLRQLELGNTLGSITAVATGTDWVFAGGTEDIGTNAAVFGSSVSAGVYAAPQRLSALCSTVSCASTGRVALALDGDLLAVGLTNDTGLNGRIALLQRQGADWLPVAGQPMPVAASGFGSAVALAGEYLAVSAPAADAVYVYRCAP